MKRGEPVPSSRALRPEDELVRYKTKDGTEKVGRFRATFGDNAVRLAPEGGGKPDVVLEEERP